QLFRGLLVIGCSSDEAKRLIGKVAVDCIPRDRARLLDLLAAAPSGLSAESMRKGESVDYPKTTVFRALEEMECLRIVERTKLDRANAKEIWKLQSAFYASWKKL